jgi:hypothetical protein
MAKPKGKPVSYDVFIMGLGYRAPVATVTADTYQKALNTVVKDFPNHHISRFRLERSKL